MKRYQSALITGPVKASPQGIPLAPNPKKGPSEKYVPVVTSTAEKQSFPWENMQKERKHKTEVMICLVL
jgi:hypothetical protein